MKKVYVIKNRYVDSVTLMGVAVELTELPGVTGAESGMGTSQNVDLLTGLDYPVPAGVTKNDLMIALDAEGPEALEAAFAAAQERLASGGGHSRRVYRSVDELPVAAMTFCRFPCPANMPSRKRAGPLTGEWTSSCSRRT